MAKQNKAKDRLVEKRGNQIREYDLYVKKINAIESVMWCAKHSWQRENLRKHKLLVQQSYNAGQQFYTA